MMRTLFNGTILTLAMLLPVVATAAIITPTSYSYTGATPAGEASYTDPSATKLTDLDTGTTSTVDGTWVGWQHGDSGAANIMFNFASSVTITNVALDFLRNGDANTHLPEIVTIGGTNFPTTDFLTDPTQGFVSYTGSWTGDSLLVTLNHSTDHWIFVNEARFTTGESPAGVPEPASLALLGIGLAGLGALRRRKQ